MTLSQNSVAKRSFEEAMERLETIVSQLEEGTIGLEESLKLFEEGVTLSRHCQDKLQNAQGRLEMLIQKEDGDTKTVSFQIEEENVL